LKRGRILFPGAKILSAGVRKKVSSAEFSTLGLGSLGFGARIYSQLPGVHCYWGFVKGGITQLFSATGENSAPEILFPSLKLGVGLASLFWC
ncbi:MAG TPA: hypothetical protein VNU93_05135, partial [Verrucomicrobiae bacterium]|nr:hypothetical protein [Verrucomicrobiae bacterium]